MTRHTVGLADTQHHTQQSQTDYQIGWSSAGVQYISGECWFVTKRLICVCVALLNPEWMSPQ